MESDIKKHESGVKAAGKRVRTFCREIVNKIKEIKNETLEKSLNKKNLFKKLKGRMCKHISLF